MQKKLTILFLLIAIPLAAMAEKWTSESLPMVHLQDSTRYTCNPDGVLSNEAVSQSDKLLRALERDKGVETVVVVVKQLKGDDPYTFGMELSRKYGIGSKKQNSGLIVILATEDRSYQILTGTGLEGTLPDAICRRIQNRIMVPQLKQKNWDAAILLTLKSIDKYVRNDALLKAELKKENKINSLAGALIALAILSFGFFSYSYAQKRNRRCPNCGHGPMRLVQKQRVRMGRSNIWCLRMVWRCPRCGHEKNEYEEEDDHMQGGSGLPPTFFGGFGGGGSSFGSGGFGGGSFGGGSFGGGGSGGRF